MKMQQGGYVMSHYTKVNTFLVLSDVWQELRSYLLYGSTIEPLVGEGLQELNS